MDLTKYFSLIEKILLVVLLIATLASIGQIIGNIIAIKEVNLADILLLFIFLEVIGMIKEYYVDSKIAISHPIFILRKLTQCQ